LLISGIVQHTAKETAKSPMIGMNSVPTQVRVEYQVFCKFFEIELIELVGLFLTVNAHARQSFGIANNSAAAVIVNTKEFFEIFI
jgi:hypothetical protein